MDMSMLTLTALLLFRMITECGGQPECGQAPPNNGNPGATPDAWPWQVSLHRSGSHLCSGLLITNEWVLSAAHCFSIAGSVIAFVGRQGHRGSNPNEQTRSVNLIISHPAFDPITFDNDVALVKLSSPVTFDYLRPICLAADGSTFFHGTESLFIVPSSLSGSLTEVEARVVGNRQCDCDRTQNTITDNMICASLTAGEEDACQGNSGGPLLSKQGSTWFLSGLLSLGFDCANPEIPGVYTRVSRYQAWISSHTGNSNSLPGFVSFMSVGTDPDLQVSCNANLPLPSASPHSSTSTGFPNCPLITCPTVCPRCSCPTRPITSTASPQFVCGVAPLNNHIVGTQVASVGAWPWQVSLHILGSHFCGGTLINSMWVLSTAHCFISRLPVTAYLGRQRQLGLNPNEVSRLVVQTIIHYAYNPLTKDNDVALLRLSHPVRFNNFIRPICLASRRSTFINGTDSWVTGWGTIGQGVPRPPPQNLKEVQVAVVGNRQCDCKYGRGVITNNMICAGLSEGEKDACQGDFGGPLMSRNGPVWVLSGLASFGRGCAQSEFPGVYTRVSRYEAWIRSYTSDGILPGFVSFFSAGTDPDLFFNCPITTTSSPYTTPYTTASSTTHMSLPTHGYFTFPPTTSPTPYTTASSSTPISVSTPGYGNSPPSPTTHYPGSYEH